jgi:hypothetical protein
MSLEFNIIYTPGTVKPLSLFIPSLLKWSNCTYRLVSNGCLPPERRFLAQLCQDNPRLTYWAIPTKNALAHGQALNYLHAKSRSEYFCFMDSDIFATGDFLSQLTPEQYAGIFSGTSIWTTTEDEILPESFKIMSGMHTRTDKGHCLGSSFFAIYNNQILTQFMQSTGIGFEEFRWHEIPSLFQQQLTAMGLTKESYDTGKVLNLLLLNQGEQMIYLDSPCLCHIGAISFIPFQKKATPGIKTKLINRLINSWLQPVIQPLIEEYRTKSAYKHFRRFTPAEFQAIVRQRKSQRDPTRQYFFRLLQTDKIPEMPKIGNIEIEQKIEWATKEIIALRNLEKNDG